MRPPVGGTGGTVRRSASVRDHDPAARAVVGPTARTDDAHLRERALALWLARLELRCRLSEADRAAVLDLPGRLETFGSGRDIVALGEETRHSCLVADGMVARFGQTAAGARLFTAFYVPGDMGDLHSAVLPRVTAPLQSALHATVFFVPHEALVAAAERSPVLARAFWRDCVVDAQVASEWMLNIGRRDARCRVSHLLCELAIRYEAAGGATAAFPMDFTQAHLADATGLTPVHVNRVLRELREMGAVAARDRRFDVLDRALLTRTGDFDPAYLHLGREGGTGNPEARPSAI